MKALFYCFALAGILGYNQAAGQATPPDSANTLLAIKNLSERYNQALEDEKHIFNGKEYISPDKYYLKGHPFFQSSEEQDGDVYYDNFLYTNIPLLYDVTLDQIVLPAPAGSLLFKLENQKVASFKVHGHTFIRLVTDSVAQSAIRTGFYDVLVDGKTKALAKRIKEPAEDITERGMEGSFLVKDKFFVFKNERYFPVSTKKSLLKIFAENKKELQKFIRSQRLSFKKENREASLVKLVQYYNNLSSAES